MLRPRPGRILAIVLAFLIALPAYASAQVWKPRSQQRADRAKAKAKASPAKNTRKAPAKTSTVKRSKKVVSKKKVTTSKKKKKKSPKKSKRRTRDDDDDFQITEENYPDED
jgi:outer membrane biosynthesis protein TonB